MISKQRELVVPHAEGAVIEVGIGSGLNMPFYDEDKVSKVVGVDPVPEMTALGEKRVASARVPVETMAASGEALPMEDNEFDTALLTYTACTIPDVAQALAEIRRVLKPSGRLLFLEHGRSCDPRVARVQDALNPMWKRMAGGCNINRDMAALIAEAGFSIDRIETYYAQSFPRFATFHYRGAAIPN